MSDSPIRIDRAGGHAVITLDRPEQRNAVNTAMATALAAAVTELGDDPGVRAIIITGSGALSFCAGADLKERATLSEGEVVAFLATLRDLLVALERLHKPVIAAINGFALGGGLELALACDIRIAVDTATLGLTEVRLGIIPGGGGTQRLPRAVGVPKAKELILTGRRVDAHEALRIGLIAEVCDAADLMPRARKIAAEIALGAPLAIAQAKAAIQDGMQVSLAEGLEVEQSAYARLLGTTDRLEALAAFRDKRPPRFEGR